MYCWQSQLKWCVLLDPSWRNVCLLCNLHLQIRSSTEHNSWITAWQIKDHHTIWNFVSGYMYSVARHLTCRTACRACPECLSAKCVQLYTHGPNTPRCLISFRPHNSDTERINYYLTSFTPSGVPHRLVRAESSQCWQLVPGCFTWRKSHLCLKG